MTTAAGDLTRDHKGEGPAGQPHDGPHGLVRRFPQEMDVEVGPPQRGKQQRGLDHHPEGGLGSAVLDALTGAGRVDLAVAHLAVREMPGSGTPAELLDASGISATHIADAARRLLADE